MVGSYGGDGEFINNCNFGNIYSVGSWAGGLIGVVGAYDGSYKNNILFLKNNYNIGNVYSTSEVGGLVADVSTQTVILENCYNLSSEVSAIGTHGGVLGLFRHYFEEVVHSVINCYNIDITYFGTSIPSTATVTNTGLINADGTFPNSTPYSDLLTALNAWVDANKSTYPELKNWVMGDNGYPTFAE